VSEADVASAEAQLKALRLRLSRTEVVAPAAGLVAARSAEVGAIASSAAGALFTLIADGEVELEALVLETALPLISAGDPASVNAAGLGTVEGKVRLVSPQVNATTRLGTVRIDLPADPNLRAGSFARAVITVERKRALVLPVAAVLNDETRSFVQVVDGEGVVRTREVEPGIIDGDRIEIREGLQEGETVLARAGAFFQDGDRVEPVPLAPRTAAAAPEARR